MRRLALTLAGFTLAAAFYLLLVDTTSLPELYVLVAVALIATVAFEAAREHGFPEARFSLRWLRRSWRAVVRVPLDTGLLCREALAQLTQPRRTRGQFRAVPFKAGTSESDRGRYALTEIVGSLAPNTIVIGVDADSDLLLVHQLRRNGDRHDIDVLELG
jgi:multisubunit Na+/H+ antiporter MnhE subunit